MRDTEVAHICPGGRPERLDARPGNQGRGPKMDPGAETRGGDLGGNPDRHTPGKRKSVTGATGPEEWWYPIEGPSTDVC